MTDKLTLDDVALFGPRPRRAARLRTYVAMVRRDRHSARLGRDHTTKAALDDALLRLEVSLVDALLDGGDTPATRRAVDVVWRVLHRNGPGSMNWNSPSTRYALQLRDLRAWDVSPGRSRDDCFALLRAAWFVAADSLDRSRDRRAARV